MGSLLPALEDENLKKLCETLRILGRNPPQSLLLEGGTETQRLQMGQYWAMAENCPSALSQNSKTPCLSCPICKKIAAFEFSDLFVFDGRISNTEDEENPGHIRSLRMDNMRDLKVILGSSPNGQGKRVVIFQGMTETREEAMNSLLKILEEPSKSTLFVLLTSQREQILPTLLSRSICLTLPWTDCFSVPTGERPFLEELVRFLKNGVSFLNKIGQKGALNPSIAASLLLECQKALARIVSGAKQKNELDNSLQPLINNPEALSLAYYWMNEAHVLLQANVNPARVMEAFSTRLFNLLHQEK